MPSKWVAAICNSNLTCSSVKRFLLRFKEKGSKEKELPVYHKLEELPDQYLKATGLEKESQSSVFPVRLGIDRQVVAPAACAH
jgi:hypothetical protein